MRREEHSIVQLRVVVHRVAHISGACSNPQLLHLHLCFPGGEGILLQQCSAPAAQKSILLEPISLTLLPPKMTRKNTCKTRSRPSLCGLHHVWQWAWSGGQSQFRGAEQRCKWNLWAWRGRGGGTKSLASLMNNAIRNTKGIPRTPCHEKAARAGQSAHVTSSTARYILPHRCILRSMCGLKIPPKAPNLFGFPGLAPKHGGVCAAFEGIFLLNTLMATPASSPTKLVPNP